jgi:hypothetical protein
LHVLDPGREVALLRSSIHPAFVIPPALSEVEGNPCAFGRVRDLLFVCPWPYSQEGNKAKRSLRIEELKSARVDKKGKGKDLTQRARRRAGPCGVRRLAAAFPSFAIPFYDGKVWVNG